MSAVAATEGEYFVEWHPTTTTTLEISAVLNL